MFRRYIGESGTVKRNKFYFVLVIFFPMIFLFVVIRVIPIISIFLMSFTNYNIRRPVTRIVFIENFQRLLTDDFFLTAFFNSMQFVLIALPAEIIIGLVVAILLNKRIRFESFYETLYFIPYILPMVPSAIIWQWIYAPGSFGLANYTLEWLGIQRVGWLTNPDIGLKSIIVMHIWKNLGFFVVVFLVGLKEIPNDFRDASIVDGASSWQMVRYIELPLMKPVILFASVMASIWALSAFTEVYIMTQGTDISTGVEIGVLVFRIYIEGFRYYQMGYASSICMVLFLVSLLLVMFQFKIFKE